MNMYTILSEENYLKYQEHIKRRRDIIAGRLYVDQRTTLKYTERIEECLNQIDEVRFSPFSTDLDFSKLCSVFNEMMKELTVDEMNVIIARFRSTTSPVVWNVIMEIFRAMVEARPEHNNTNLPIWKSKSVDEITLVP